MIKSFFRLFNRVKRKQARFDKRSDMPIDQLYQQYYKDFKLNYDDFCYIWEHISYHLEVSKEKLRPSDRFDHELAPEDGLELVDEIEDLIVFVKVESEKRKIIENLDDVRSVNELVLILVSKDAF